MKREDVKKLLENGVLQAYAEGKAIQAFSESLQEWYDCGEVCYFPVSPDRRFRVKPEPAHDWVWRQHGYAEWHMIRSATESHMKARFPKEDFEYRMLVPVSEED